MSNLIPISKNGFQGCAEVFDERCDVLILSASYGGGHNQVAKAISMALQLQVPGIKISTIDYCDLIYPPLSRFSQFSYMQSLRHFPVGYALYYQVTDNIASDSFWQRRLNRLGYSELTLLINRLEPRLIIATFPLAAGVLSEMREAGDLKTPIITVITDICVHSQWVHPRTDLYLVGSPEVAEGLRERGIERDAIAVTGIPIMPSFNCKCNKEAVRIEFGFRPNDRVILFMGGTEGHFGTTRFDQLLEGLPGNIKAVVITANNHELYDKLQPLHTKDPNLRILKHVENIAGLMDIAEVLVTKAGGVTVSEALAKGLPMIIYKPNPGHEEANADYLLRHHAALVTKREYRLKSALERLVLDDSFRERFRRNCLKLAIPNSAEISAKLIKRMLNLASRELDLEISRSIRSEIRA